VAAANEFNPGGSFPKSFVAVGLEALGEDIPSKNQFPAGEDSAGTSIYREQNALGISTVDYVELAWCKKSANPISKAHVFC